MRKRDVPISTILAIIDVSGFILVIIIGMLSSQSARRGLIDLKSDLGGGLNRVVRVYTADGELMAEYKGKIDLEMNEGGYIKFDHNGKRYIYYNCFVESIADISGTSSK